jgi:hypothetical protein
VSQRIRKQEFDQQFTDYVVEPIERLNWPEGPPCRLVTKRFRREDQALVAELFRVIVNRQDIDVTQLLDLKAMLRRSGIPEGPMENVTKETGGQGEPGA